LFNLDQYADSVAALQQAANLGNKQTDLWLRKAQAELAAAAKPAAPAAPSNASKANAATAPTFQLDPLPAVPAAPVVPLAQKTREAWFQTKDSVTITLFAKDLSRDKVTSSFLPEQINVHLVLPDASELKKQWTLYAPIVVDRSSIQVTPYKVELILAKAKAEDWDTLEQKQSAVQAIKRENTITPTADPKAYPSSVSKKTDWEDLEKSAKKAEEEEKPDGEAALHKLFQKIYSGASEDTRRAMVKSYQTSGGTVLSTNWKEVAQKDYTKDRTAPKGQEFRDWDK